MKRQLPFVVVGAVVLFTALAIGSCCGQANFGISPSAWTCSGWDELTPEAQQRLETASKAVIDQIGRRDLQALWNTAHDDFKRGATPTKLLSDMDKLGVTGAGLSKAVLSKGYAIGVTRVAPGAVPVKCGVVRGPESVTINVQGGIRQHAVMFYTYPEPPFERLLTIRLDESGERYAVIGFDINTRSYRSKGSDYYDALSERNEAKGELLPAALHALRAAAFAMPGRGISTKQSTSTMERAKALIKSKELQPQVECLRFEGRPFKAFYFEAFAMQDGLQTIISYVSYRPVGPDTTPVEAEGYMAAIRKAFPTLGDELETLTLRAYAELPRSKTQRPAYHEVRLPLRPEPRPDAPPTVDHPAP